jgi:hypothetical protein
MTREARTMAGLILITVPTIQYGGYFLLTSLRDKSSHYMENALRQNFFPRRPCSCGSVCYSRVGVPGACGFGESAGAAALARAHWRASGCNFSAHGLFPLHGLANGDPAERIRLPHLRRRGSACRLGIDARNWPAPRTRGLRMAQIR